MRTFALSSCIGLCLTLGLLVACVTTTTPKPFKSTWPGSIYFVARETRTGVEALYRITSGTDPQMVYQPRAHDSNFATSVDQMVCSPDGKKIAMQQTDSGGIPHLGGQFGKSRLIILDLESRTEREVSDPNMLDLGAPTWSPDGSQLLATSSHRWPPTSFGPPYWYLVDTKTLQVTPFVDGEGKEIAGYDPTWSPDGKWIFSFSTSFPDPGKGSFVNAQTGAKRRDSIPDVGGDPRWSPTGKLIAYFWAGRQDKLQSGRTLWQIRTTEVSTLKTRTLTSGAIDSQPNWSPDEKWILFSRRESLDKSNGLFVVETGNSTAYKLMVNFDEPVAPTWCR